MVSSLGTRLTLRIKEGSCAFPVLPYSHVRGVVDRNEELIYRPQLPSGTALPALSLLLTLCLHHHACLPGGSGAWEVSSRMASPPGQARRAGRS